MKKLFISIIFAVFGSLFFISWGVDQFIAKHSDESEYSDTLIYENLIEGISAELNNTPEPQLSQRLTLLAKRFSLDLTLESTSAIALPPALFKQLSEKGGLLLASEKQAYLVKQLTTFPQHLVKLHLPTASEEDQQLNVFLTAILYLGVGIILILWLLPLAQRLYLLTQAAELIGKGEKNVRVKLSRFSYISLLESRFNQMAYQIEKLMADNKLLARSLSHDIRTPMSCLRFGIDAALEANDVESKNNYLKRMELELSRMEDMTSAFLSYASMERQGVHLNVTKIEVNQLISTLCQDFKSLAQQHNISFEYKDLVNEEYISGDLYWLNRALQNLITNAIHYAKSRVFIRAKISHKNINIIIEDDGKGIEKEKLTAIFDPFVKLDPNRSREQGHFGLGLAICHKVVDWHHGKISASQSTSLKGAKFILSIPREC
ncbi:ATP-binding protein [Thalassotalea sp. 1_MG-2023]|uniref:sensor histidine kinase n=1 Tax=Thalassotalea sp. 1_MG-2023 TaxID=3062680 RepID=UPI0026E26BDE|nr:ATP-binding protein [Thalassotalea sp. 1_MG-2023]MDO6427154.1 ATP-binding protein [Thalassotalea sp. 1_MG-2023]